MHTESWEVWSRFLDCFSQFFWPSSLRWRPWQPSPYPCCRIWASRSQKGFNMSLLCSCSFQRDAQVATFFSVSRQHPGTLQTTSYSPTMLQAQLASSKHPVQHKATVRVTQARYRTSAPSLCMLGSRQPTRGLRG